MTRMTPLLERNQRFAAAYTPAPPGLPVAQVLIVTCLDHRVDPAIILGLRLGDAPVIRNAGGRVTQAVIDDLAFLATSPGSCSAAKTRTTGSSRSRSSTTPNAEPAFLPTPASGTRPPKRPACPRQRWKPPPSQTRTPPSRLTSSACSPHPCSHPKSASPATCTTSPPDASPPRWTPGTHNGLAAVPRRGRGSPAAPRCPPTAKGQSPAENAERTSHAVHPNR